MNRVGHETRPNNHAHHDGEAPANRGRVPWRLLYVLILVAAAISLFLLVQDGGSSALLVLFAGLMALHHLPGGHRHGHVTPGSYPGTESSLRTTTDDTERSATIAPRHH